MNDQRSAIYIELNVHPVSYEGPAVYVNSKDVPGLHVIGKCFQNMKPMLERVIVRLFKDNKNMDVNLIWLQPMGDGAGENVLQRVAVYGASAELRVA